MIFLNSYKKNYFYKRRSLDKRNCLLCFALDHWHEKVLYMVFTRNISEVARGQVLFLRNFITKIRGLLFPSRTLKYISQEYPNYSFTYLHTSQSGLILVVSPVIQIWIHKPNVKTRKFCTLNYFRKLESTKAIL